VVRTQIQLTEEQMTRLRRASVEHGISITAFVREAVDQALEGDERKRQWERALSVIGKYRDVDAATDVATRHDDYLADAYEDWRR
jgi:plasmid stability protein